MEFEAFRAEAHRFVDWMADYLAGLERERVRSAASPGDLLAALPASPPEDGESMSAIFADFQRLILPGITHWQHPRFLAYFPANSSPPSILAEMLTAALAAQGMLWETSPAANELETRVCEWMRDLLGLPEAFRGVIQDSASSSTLVALIAARERALPAAARQGLAGSPPLAVYTSSEAHSSVEKAVRIAGIGSDFLRKIPVGRAQAMSPEQLRARIRQDRADGVVPCAIVASLGATGVAAVDPLREIGEIARDEGVYLHVDAAWAGSALILPRYRALLDGIEHVDSLVTNPHKWLFTNFDCSLHFVRDPTQISTALSLTPPYLRSDAGEAMPEYRDLSLALGRRFRALKLWFVLRSYGAERLRAMIAAHIGMAEALADRIRRTEDFEVAVEPRFSLLAFRWRPPFVQTDAEIDAANERLLAAVNDDGRTYLTRGVLDGRVVIRVVVGQTYTRPRHVEEAWSAVCAVAALLQRTAG